MSIDLTRDFPRSPREELDGMRILPRAIDKARAQIAGTLGEYIYFNCGILRVLFDTLGISDEQFLDAVRRSPDDQSVVRWIETDVQPDRRRLDEMNERILVLTPQPEQQSYFQAELNAADPGNTEVTRWLDLLDLQEGRLPKLKQRK